MSTFGAYDHMNEKDTQPFSIKDTAAYLMNTNYGVQRLLCEIVRQREADTGRYGYRRQKEDTAALRELLEKDWF